jgi:hypothetical protein
MIEQEARKKSQEKIAQITNLAKVLKVEINAEQVISKNNVIKTVVVFTDTEEYDIDKPKEIVREPIDNPTGPTGPEAK